MTAVDLNDIFASFNTIDKDLVPYSESDVGLVKDWGVTLIPSVDKVMINGIPISDRVTEIYGQSSTGKSTFVANLISKLQKQGAIVIYFDTELTLNRERLVELGVDPSKIVSVKPQVNRNGVVQQMTVESICTQILDLTTKLHKAYPDNNIVCVWDTIANTMADSEANKDLDEKTVGQQAHALSIGMRKIVPFLSSNNASLIALNQARDKFGETNPYLAKESKTVGGKAMEHADSLKLYMVKGAKIRENPSDTKSAQIGHTVRLKFMKSKLGDNTGAVAELALLDDTGYDLIYNTLLDAQNLGWVNRGKYISDNGEEIGKRSFNGFLDYLRSDEGQDIFIEIWQKLLLHYFPDCYPALFNTHAVLKEEDFPMITGLREYYIKQQESLLEEKRNGTYNLWKENKDNQDYAKKVLKAAKKAGE